MKSPPGTDEEPFTRVAYLNYNDITYRYEWNSMDTHALQMVHKTNYLGADPGQYQERRVISFGDYQRSGTGLSSASRNRSNKSCGR